MDNKLTVQYYANTDLKPQKFVVGDQEELRYPLYVRIIYKSKSTKFRFAHDDSSEGIYVDEDLEMLKDDPYKGLIRSYRELLETMIEAEEGFGPLKYKHPFFTKDEFSIIGIANRVKVYQTRITDILGKENWGHMIHGVRVVMDELEYDVNEVEVITAIAQFHYQFLDIKVWEWFFIGKHEELVKIGKAAGFSDSVIEVAIALIDIIVGRKI
ncbi:MAG: hypothetical protein KDD15_15850 [Lewinella sp.]|nr:hypothetical protein [Lewinella sp.]